MNRLLIVALLCCSTAFAANKPEPAYQDAVLKSFHTAINGATCSTNASPVYGTDSVTADTDCTSRKVSYYVIAIGDQTITVTPISSKKETAAKLFSVGYAGFFMKNSSLYGELPNTTVKIRQDSPGTYYILAGKRESLYKLVAAE